MATQRSDRSQSLSDKSKYLSERTTLKKEREVYNDYRVLSILKKKWSNSIALHKVEADLTNLH